MALDQDILFLYAPPWHGPTRFSKHHLATCFAQTGSRVLYVEAPLTPLALRRGARAFSSELVETFRPPARVAERLWTRRNFVPLPYHGVSRITSARLVNRIGQRLTLPTLRRDLKRLGFNNPVVIAGLPHAVDAVEGVPRRCLVYHCADDYTHVRGFPGTLPALEADLCRAANLVITTSETLREARRQFNANTHWVPNGADVEHFSAPAAPSDQLLALGRPVVGFIGGLSQWVDIELIAGLAHRRPAWQFALIGPIGVDVRAVQGVPNVHLLGARPYASLPTYLAAMDVALIPFRNEPVSYHADPIKAYEYLAAGVPVVASALPALGRLAHVVRLADSPAEFEQHIAAAIDEGRDAGRDARQAEAQRHSWSSRFAQIESLLQRACDC